MEETMFMSNRTDANTQDSSGPSKTFFVEPTGEDVIINGFNTSVDILDLSAFIRSDVSEALQNAQGTENAILTFFDGTKITINGVGMTGETVRQAEIVVSGSNQIAQGNIVISGVFDLGETLTAEIQNLSDRDGIREDTLQIQWFRDDQPIDGAIGETYSITDADFESALTARVSFVDLFGRKEVISSNIVAHVDAPDTGDEGSADSPLPSDANEDQAVDDVPSIGDGVNDTPVTATPFQDVFTVRGGIDHIDGLAGVDIAVFPGDQSNYVVTLLPNGASVFDKRADGLGTVSLENIEIIGFETHQKAASPRVDLRQFDSYSDLTSEQFDALIEIYIAYYNRAPDAVGLAFWSNAYAEGMSLADIAAMFIEQEETRSIYPENENNLGFVADVYNNVLGRAPDLEGLMFWEDSLNSGEVTRDTFILEVLQGVRAEPLEDASQTFIELQLADQSYLDLKTDLGVLFAVQNGMSNVESASQIMAMFDGSLESFAEASDAIQTAYGSAMTSENGDFLMPLVGISDDTFIV